VAQVAGNGTSRRTSPLLPSTSASRNGSRSPTATIPVTGSATTPSAIGPTGTTCPAGGRVSAGASAGSAGGGSPVPAGGEDASTPQPDSARTSTTAAQRSFLVSITTIMTSQAHARDSRCTCREHTW